jgi:DNA repair protein RecO (recombination protein O)
MQAERGRTMIVRATGVILRAMDFRESSRILTVYTREFGKQSILAKGVRGPKSRLAGVTGPLNYVSLIYYRKEQRELQLLSQCDLVRPWRALSDSLEAMGAAMATCELLNMVVQGEEAHPALFELLVRSLDAVNGARANAVNAFYLFEIRLLDLLGFRPELRRCVRCGRAVGDESGGLAFDIHRGSVVCPECAVQGGEGRSSAAYGVLCRLQEISDIDAACRISLSPGLRGEVATLLRRYLQAHVDGLRSLKSESVFSAIL